MNDQQIEQEIQAKGLTAPRLRPSDIEAEIVHEVYCTPADAVRFAWITSDPVGRADLERKDRIIESLPTRSYSGACIDIDANTNVPPALGHVTICVLILRNGHKIVGVNTGPVSGANFDVELARKMARQNAIDQIWPLMGFLLRERLLEAERATAAQPPADNAHVAPGCEQFPETTPATLAICPRAAENGDLSMLRPPFNGEMVWRVDDTCSYCGSLNGDILMARIEAGTIRLKGSDKNYKIYVEATEGSEPLSAIKFYFQHLSEVQKIRFVELWNEKRIIHSMYVMPYFMHRVDAAEASPLIPNTKSA